MKCSELLRLLLKNGWYIVSKNGSHSKLRHPIIRNTIIFPDHGSREISKGLEKWIKKVAKLNN